ncbi:MAG: hypothetical protein C0467_23370 [Planctomycetaceae bacterium]|nr:hypothetical protein [Planctomycetaceae bacterium]
MLTFLRAAARIVAVVGTADAALACKIVPPSPPARRAIMAETVVVGKVTGFENELVQALPHPGVKEKVGFKVATIKIDTGLIVAGNTKEIRIGSIAPVKLDPNAPIGAVQPIASCRHQVFELKEGQELILFLAKHPSGDFYTIPSGTPPVDLKTEQGKKDLESVKNVVAILADPIKALKSEKPEVRAEAATVMVLKHRNYPVLGGEVEQVAIGADENTLVLKALTEGDWGIQNARFDAPPSPFQAFQSLNLTAKDGWITPVIVNAPGAPPVDYGMVQKDAFMKWLDGAGKNYQIKKLVPKTQK